MRAQTERQWRRKFGLRLNSCTVGPRNSHRHRNKPDAWMSGALLQRGSEVPGSWYVQFLLFNAFNGIFNQTLLIYYT